MRLRELVTEKRRTRENYRVRKRGERRGKKKRKWEIEWVRGEKSVRKDEIERDSNWEKSKKGKERVSKWESRERRKSQWEKVSLFFSPNSLCPLRVIQENRGNSALPIFSIISIHPKVPVVLTKSIGEGISSHSQIYCYQLQLLYCSYCNGSALIFYCYVNGLFSLFNWINSKRGWLNRYKIISILSNRSWYYDIVRLGEMSIYQDNII